MSKRANHLRVQAAAVTWGDRGARINSISPGIILTPLARDEMSGPGAAGYRAMIEKSAAGRVGTPDEVATAAGIPPRSRRRRSSPAPTSSWTAASSPHFAPVESVSILVESPAGDPPFPSTRPQTAAGRWTNDERRATSDQDTPHRLSYEWTKGRRS